MAKAKWGVPKIGGQGKFNKGSQPVCLPGGNCARPNLVVNLKPCYGGLIHTPTLSYMIDKIG